MSAPEVGDTVTVGGEQYEVLRIVEGPEGPAYQIVSPNGQKMQVNADQIGAEGDEEPEPDAEAEAEAKAKAQTDAEAAEAEEKAKADADAEAAKAEAEEKARQEAESGNPPA